LRWSYDLPMPALSVRGYAMPLIAGDLVIAASAAGKIVALDLKTGAGRWESQLATPQGRTEIERLTDIDGDMLLTFDENSVCGRLSGAVGRV
jgi:outer membrane protein assembly factor BamB